MLDLNLLQEALGRLVLESLVLRGELSQCQKSLELLRSEVGSLRSKLSRFEGSPEGSEPCTPLAPPPSGP